MDVEVLGNFDSKEIFQIGDKETIILIFQMIR